MLERMLDRTLWDEFLRHRGDGNFVDERERREMQEFFEGGSWEPLCRSIAEGNYIFSIPRKMKIAKNDSGKKRVVYSFSREEMIVLKFISYLLYQYDGLFCDNLYSFRRGRGVKTAVGNLSRIAGLRRMYGVKVDVSSYFNSIDPDILLGELRGRVDDDLHRLLSNLLTRQEVLEDRSVVREKTGAMPGVPFSPFLANFYLGEMDWHFREQPVVYMRYADDILLFARTEEELEEHYAYMMNYLRSRGLGVNESKLARIRPGEEFEFLGFSFSEGTVDVSAHSVAKMKAKISRKARALRRWYLGKGLTPDKALIAMNKRFNLKFYGTSSGEMSWKYWYFPLINSSARLGEVDRYMQQMQRWICTGRHSKVNYRECSYDQLKRCGYRPLVGEYYSFFKN